MAGDHSIRITYVVNHGVNAPRVGLSTEVLGGRVEVVALGDLVQRLDRAEMLLRSALAYVEHEDAEMERQLREFLCD